MIPVTTAVDAVMTTEPDEETHCHSLSTMPDSEDSEEETSQDERLVTSWNELSIIERVGLNSAEMSEKDLESAFSQIALAFRCDQYTLKQRLQAEEHARNLAEENIQLELTRGRETLETLKGLCLDSERSKILQRLQLSLDILSGTVERISSTAEVLGAVHQEARVSRAVELMVAHVENLKRRHDRNVAALEEAKKLIQQQESCSNSSDPRASPDPEDSDNRQRSSQQNSGRRRVSISLISSQNQRKQELRKGLHEGSPSKKSLLACPSPSLSFEPSCSALTRDDSYSVDDRTLDPDETPLEALAVQLPTDTSPTNRNSEWPPPKQLGSVKTQNRNSLLDTLQRRHKAKSVLSKKKADKDKSDIYQRVSVNTYGSSRRPRPLVHWLYRCRWALLCMYLFVLFAVVTLTYYLTT